MADFDFVPVLENFVYLNNQSCVNKKMQIQMHLTLIILDKKKIK